MNKFGHFSVLIECSFGNTPKVSAIKEMIDKVAKMGYNEMVLGVTDGYKMDGEPFFNYKRGGYTTDDFREMDEYAKARGIELMANIQTLGHLHFIDRHESYKGLMDTDSILMVGEEKVYELIDKMFATISRGLSSRRIHIGYDECYGLGTGNYLKKNGPADKKELLLRHLKQVVKIAKKYDYTCEIWHDMLIERTNTKVTPEDVKASLPEGTIVHYWNYFEIGEEKIRAGIRDVKKHAENTGYAGSAFKCGGMAPLNTFSIARLITQMKVAAEEGLDRFMVTLWSDNGAWVNNFTVLPALYACAMFNQGKWDGKGDPDKKEFKEIVQVEYDDMMLFDHLDDPFFKKEIYAHSNLSFFIMLSDILNGGWDLLYSANMPDAYLALSKMFKEADGGNFEYLFENGEKFAQVLAKKCTIGVGLRKAYKDGNREECGTYVKKLKNLAEMLEEYALAYAKTWNRDSMPYGLEVDQLFLGGQVARIRYIANVVKDYAENGTPIAELENETVLPDLPEGTNQFNLWNSNWREIVSNCGFM